MEFVTKREGLIHYSTYIDDGISGKKLQSDHFTQLNGQIGVVSIDGEAFINFDVIQVIKEGKYQKLLVVTQPKDLYMLVIEDSRLESKLLEGDTLHVNGRFLTTYKYIANNNTEKEVPLIYIDAYTLVGD